VGFSLYAKLEISGEKQKTQFLPKILFRIFNAKYFGEV
jgi:hypothetical protein